MVASHRNLVFPGYEPRCLHDICTCKKIPFPISIAYFHSSQTDNNTISTLWSYCLPSHLRFAQYLRVRVSHGFHSIAFSLMLPRSSGNCCGSESIQLNAMKLTKKFEYISRNTPAVIAECMRDYFVIFFVCR